MLQFEHEKGMQSYKGQSLSVRTLSELPEKAPLILNTSQYSSFLIIPTQGRHKIKGQRLVELVSSLFIV